MKLVSLLDPSLPLPWNDVPLGYGDTATTDAVFLTENDPFQTDLVLPIGHVGQAYTKAVEALALRPNQIVIHTGNRPVASVPQGSGATLLSQERRSTSLHYVAHSLMGDIPMLVKSTDYVLRLSRNNRISPAAIYAQLACLWAKVTVNRENIASLVNETEIAPVSEHLEILAEEALAIMVDAQNLARRAALRRAEAREVLAMISSSGMAPA